MWEDAKGKWGDPIRVGPSPGALAHLLATPSLHPELRPSVHLGTDPSTRYDPSHEHHPLKINTSTILVFLTPVPTTSTYLI
jgi:hypothetical protein